MFRLFRRQKCKQIVLVIDHPFGIGEISLEDWIKQGPMRKYTSPKAAKCATTGRQLSLWIVLPFRYHNSMLSRLVIKLGFIENPWDAP